VKLLVVDDANIMRTRIAKVAAVCKARHIEIVGQAANGVQAVAFAKAIRPDVITMDLTMPEMDGVAAIEALMLINPKFNILVVSALSDKATAIAALRMGARGFLAKPFTDAQLEHALLDVANPEA
jgi:two-component system, chemotaxis family, chemotaxis protein CheY